MLLALLLLTSFEALAAPAAPPSTGQAIPPTGPGTPGGGPPPTPVDDSGGEPADGADDSGDEDLFQTTETPEGVDSSRRESEIYGARIDGMQADVDDLKERVFRSKARLSVLKETVLHGVLAGSRVIIVHRNLMSSQFRLTKLAVVLDGAQIYARTDDSGALDQEDELVVLDGNIVPGPHTITVELTYQGQGFGVFSYLNGYTFESRSSHNFTAPENGALRLLSSGYEKGNLSTEMKDRPSVEWQEIPLDASGKPLPQSQRKAAKGGGKKTKSKSKPATKMPGDSSPAEKPGAQQPGGAQSPQKPGAQSPQKPGAQSPQKPGAQSPQKPGAQKPGAQKPADTADAGN